MVFLILVAFIGIPLIEIGLFIQVGGFIGMWPTILVVILTAIIGATLLRHQGLETMARLQASLERGEEPIGPLFDGVCVLLAGLLLLTPGFFTDALGFLLFTPPLRAALRRVIAKRISLRTMKAGASSHATWSQGHPLSDDIIDADYKDVTDQKNRPRLPDELQ